MDTVTAHSTTNQSNPTGSSYVDAYTPPAAGNSAQPTTPIQSAWSTPAPATPMQTYTQPEPVAPAISSYTPPVMSQVNTAQTASPILSAPSVSPVTAPAVQPTAESVSPVTPTPADSAPISAPAPAPTAPTQNSNAPQSSSEELEDQNIFFMLGVMDGTSEQKEAFLDELQQVIWEDFLEFDVKLLITRDEQAELAKMLAEESSRDLEKQEKVVIYLEKLVPDLEEIMLEKALELKEEMARERVKGMREFYADKPDVLTQLDKANELMNVGKWHATATLLNAIK